MNNPNSQLTREEQEEFEKLKIYLASLLQFLGDKARMVPVIASLSATVLVVATFNPNLIAVTHGLKMTLTILLALIPISLLFYLLELTNAIEKVNKKINIKLPKESLLPRIYGSLFGYFPFIGTAILGGAIVYIVFLLWH